MHLKKFGFLGRVASFLVLALWTSLASAGGLNGVGLKVGMVLDKGGKDDKSFNASAYSGANRAKDELKIQYKYVEATDDNAFEPLLRSFAQKDFDLIIGVGFAQAEAMAKVSKAFPNKLFAIVDSDVKGANVRSLMFEEHEGSFLMGAVAALKSKSGKIGFIGGMAIPLIKRFEMGFEAGVKHVNPKATVTSNFVGVTADSWNNPPKAKELALGQFNNGVDVIFQAAGASGSGVFDAAEEKKKFAIGVDSNQNWMKPGVILTSMMKRVDISVYETIKEVAAARNAEGKLPADFNKTFAGLKRFGLKNSGVDYALDSHNQKEMSADVKKKIDDLKGQITSGKIKVPDFYTAKAGKK
ncbi:MAG: BMP family ABC transporter substrate-binding protein [Bdellovibrionales bacterium]|nr:BMP family ABC transporter substrate-binding protein [Bdellovibrionales bacterium]